MKQYQKIKTVWNRNPDNKFKTLLAGDWSKNEFIYLAHNRWVCTEKIDGMNMRVRFSNNIIDIKGKSNSAQIPPFLLTKMQQLFPLELMQKVFGPGQRWNAEYQICLYGEGYGAKIQKDGETYISADVNFILFDVLINDIWMPFDTVQQFGAALHINTVPIVYEGNLNNAIAIVQTGFKSHIADRQAEGLIMKPLLELTDRLDNRIITKVKCKDFA